MIGGSEQTQVQLLAEPAQLLGCPRIVGDCLLLVRVRVHGRVHGRVRVRMGVCVCMKAVLL